jgi:hypothetical protein
VGQKNLYNSDVPSIDCEIQRGTSVFITAVDISLMLKQHFYNILIARDDGAMQGRLASRGVTLLFLFLGELKREFGGSTGPPRFQITPRRAWSRCIPVISSKLDDGQSDIQTSTVGKENSTLGDQWSRRVFE